ncbi:MAG TPA: 50S ribosomal protein L23 [Nitrososphaera sp.]|nr:50S ribosomal protein L23 [Nitrososphaera sp.]
MSKEIATRTTTEADKTQGAAPEPKSSMSSEQAATLIMAPYVTEKTFNQIERENKLAFIVAENATKKQIIEGIHILYEADITEVNTTRTIRGKKAFVKFKSPEGARELATKLALV